MTKLSAIESLLKAHKDMKPVIKDSTNPHFKNSYASLGAVIDATSTVFRNNGFVVMQPCGRDELGAYVETRLLHTTGESFSSKVYLVLDKQNMQGLGSAITYARRYGLLGMANREAEDDDGNEASKPSTKIPDNKKPIAWENYDALTGLPNKKSEPAF